MNKEKTTPINILITGDFAPINRVEELSVKGNFQSVFNDFIDVFKNNDLNVVDLECPLTHANTTRPKTGPYQKAHPDTIGALRYADVSLLAMANNHIMDYGEQGVKDTLALCQQNGMATIGIGSSHDEAAKPYVLEQYGKKIALINYADNEFLSTPNGNYTCNPIDPVNSYYDIDQAARHNDFVIVIVHAGNEFYRLPSPRTKKLYRYLADQGADAIIAHHTHVFSGYEIYKGKPIFYGLGNFVYDWPGKIHSDWNRGYVVRLSFTDTLAYKIIPLKQSNTEPGVHHLTDDEKGVFDADIRTLNNIIANDNQLEAEFKKYCQSVFPMYDAFIEPNFGRYITALQKRGWLPKLLSRQKRLFHLNLSRCESHRDVLLRLLKKYE
ncbi:poly-gamma-glutamate synthesis protein (capsule biosynthesis protein) [Saccharicrinis carchari]|uniref:Poly-gamma-glutamate synthesis protein (Capsule biosynthesis protein) n=1 Tax=Saccharicrinis carchari TaxID=1168039 RepID=A0A521BT66_SACCC|nr:CapA family protein [Saccharicrinis carchari]SMO50346.1 poly-gamma-glutamate synthesis protein (capsule biosynthesis protein) [Saccharicrinis carchari]